MVLLVNPFVKVWVMEEAMRVVKHDFHDEDEPSKVENCLWERRKSRDSMTSLRIDVVNEYRHRDREELIKADDGDQVEEL